MKRKLLFSVFGIGFIVAALSAVVLFGCNNSSSATDSGGEDEPGISENHGEQSDPAEWEERFYYEQKSDGSIAINAYSGEPGEQLIIPGEIDGKVVSEISHSVFEEKFPLGSETNTIKIPASVRVIEMYAFTGNAGIERVMFEEGSSLECIGSSVFSGCSSLADIVLPSGVKELGSCAFEDCALLTGMFELPSSVEVISYSAFTGCAASEFRLSPSNGHYIVEDGVLYTKNQEGDAEELVAYPAGKRDESFTIPATVSSIGQYAVTRNRYIKSVNLNNVEKIDYYGLSDCENLTAVVGEKVVHTGEVAIAGVPWLDENSAEYVAVGKVLLRYNGTDAVVDIGGYTEVDDCAFMGNGYIEEVIAGKGIEAFGSKAFYGCVNLKRLVLPSLRHPVYVTSDTFNSERDKLTIAIPRNMVLQYANSFNNSGWDQYHYLFEEINTVITFDSRGGSSCYDVTAFYGNQPELPEPRKEGYDFVGWSLSVGGTTAEDCVGNDTWLLCESAVTLYAVWESTEV